MQSISIFQQDSVRDKEDSSLAISDSSYRNLIFFTSKIILEKQNKVQWATAFHIFFSKRGTADISIRKNFTDIIKIKKF